ncbi:MAG TPA: hypothetical protein VMA37_00840 [Acetobacteraceae bacterium]|nr:hypothetical protein [Acetobacteraceae bacterium]
MSDLGLPLQGARFPFPVVERAAARRSIATPSPSPATVTTSCFAPFAIALKAIASLSFISFLERDEIACAHSSRSRSLFSYVRETYGQSTSGHHALSCCLDAFRVKMTRQARFRQETDIVGKKMNSVSSTNVRQGLTILVATLLLAYALGVAEYWHFAYFYSHHIGDLYSYQNQLLEGHAPWLADQNRVLAPLLIEAIRRVFRTDYADAYHHFMFWTFVGQNLCAAILFRQCRLTLGQSAIGLFLAASVPMLLFNFWWFPWTNLEAMLFLLMFTADAAPWSLRARASTLALIFLGMILTKETAIFLPIWLFLRQGSTAILAGRPWARLLPMALLCSVMIFGSLLVDAELRHLLWVSSTFANDPSGNPPGNLPVVFGTHVLILDYPLRTVGYYARNFLALVTFRIPWPLFFNAHWTAWPAGAVDFFIASGVSVPSAVWSWRHRDHALFALALFSLAYLAVCFLLVNMPESDKLMPVLVAGVYAYARRSAPVRQNGLRPRQLTRPADFD